MAFPSEPLQALQTLFQKMFEKLDRVHDRLTNVEHELDVLRSRRRLPPRFVYLAGPILDCNFGEANDWRHYVAGKLLEHNIIGISPLRCEPIHGEIYTTEYPDPKFGTPRAIFAKNKFDVRHCDVTLALLPLPAPGRYPSVGTLEEIGWADEAGKMVIQVTDDPRMIAHPVLDGTRGWRMVVGDDRHGLPFDSIQHALDGAVETIVGVLGGYAGGKNV